jgi:hypothetical protein
MPEMDNSNQVGRYDEVDRAAVPIIDVMDEADAEAADAEDLTAMPGGLPAIPRTTAVKRLAEALQGQGHSEGAARAIARIIVRPEEARRRLQNPDLMRVPGGVLETLSTQVWTAGVSPFPGNNREASQRVYPLSGALREGLYPSLGPTNASPGPTGELVLSAQSRAHIVSGLDRSSALLAQQNDLATTIGEHGILRDLLLSVVRIEHEDMTPPAWIIAADDGSSRVTGAQRNQELDAEQVVYQFPADDRAFRGYIGGVLADAMRPTGELTTKEVSRARSLVAPATLILRFRPDESSGLRYDQAVRFIVGITHVEPPKPWGSASENDALGDAVIEEFLDSRRISQAQSQWYAATLAPDEAAKHGFDIYPDARIAEIAGRFLPDSSRASFRRGALRITAKGRINAEFKTKIVAEMVLRPWRSAQPNPDLVSAVRSTVQRMLTWPVLREDGWQRGTNDPDKLLAEALVELGSRGSSGAAGVELGIRAGYYLAIHRRLQREKSASSLRDFRAPSSVLQRMTESEHGLRMLHEAIISGRAGRPAARVDASGAPERNQDRQVILADDPWIRSAFPPADGSAEPVEGNVDTPESLFERERRQVAQLVESLDNAVTSASAVIGQARPLVRERGWPPQEAENLANQLTVIASRLRLWGAIAESTEEAEANDEAGEA